MPPSLVQTSGLCQSALAYGRLEPRNVRLRVIMAGYLAWGAMRWFLGNSSPFDIAAEIAIVSLFVYEIWVKEPLAKWRSRRRLADTFALRVGKANILGASRNSIAKSVDLDLSVYVAHTTDIDRFNIRLAEDKYGGRVSPELIRIENVWADVGSVHYVSDRDGGMECTWVDAIPRRHATKALNLKVRIGMEQPQEWKGVIGYQGYDADGTQRIVRHPVCAHSVQCLRRGHYGGT
jgi:hypothetical protein